MKQQTIKSAFEIAGTGLHSGHSVRCCVEPAPDGNGYTFERLDLPGSPVVPGHWSAVASGQFATTLVCGDSRVSTVEHLLAALYGMGVDNAHIRLDADEAALAEYTEQARALRERLEGHGHRSMRDILGRLIVGKGSRQDALDMADFEILTGQATPLSDGNGQAPLARHL